jgi:hypothetical protein
MFELEQQIYCDRKTCIFRCGYKCNVLEVHISKSGECKSYFNRRKKD